MLIVISLKNIEKMFFFITNCLYVGFKMGSKVIKCNNRSIFTNCVCFSLVQQQDVFKTLKRVEVFQKAQINMLMIKPLWKHPFMGFTKTYIVSFVQL